MGIIDILWLQQREDDCELFEETILVVPAWITNYRFGELNTDFIVFISFGRILMDYIREPKAKDDVGQRSKLRVLPVFFPAFGKVFELLGEVLFDTVDGAIIWEEPSPCDLIIWPKMSVPIGGEPRGQDGVDLWMISSSRVHLVSNQWLQLVSDIALDLLEILPVNAPKTSGIN